MKKKWKNNHPVNVAFDIDGRNVSGMVTPKRKAMGIVEVLGENFHDLHSKGEMCLHGVSSAGAVTLLNCSAFYITTTSSHVGTVTSGKCRFSYAVVGQRHISPDEKSISGISFGIRRNPFFFGWPDIMEKGVLHSPSKSLIDLIDVEAAQCSAPRLSGGPFPIVSYDTGNRDIASGVDTVIGKVYIRRGPTVWLAFDEPISFRDMEDRFRTICRFLAFMGGYHIEPVNVVLHIEAGEKSDYAHMHLSGQGAATYNKCPGSSMEPMMRATENSEDYKVVMKKWLEVDAQRTEANMRFHSVVTHRQAIEHRVLIAASAYEALPTNGKLTLKQKIMESAHKVVGVSGHYELPFIEDAVAESVHYRNWRAHGINYRGCLDPRDPEVGLFLGDTLLSIYWLAEFIECGGDIAALKHISLRHPATSWLHRYAREPVVAELQKSSGAD